MQRFHEDKLVAISHKSSRAVWVVRDKEGLLRVSFNTPQPSKLLCAVIGDEIEYGSWGLCNA